MEFFSCKYSTFSQQIATASLQKRVNNYRKSTTHSRHSLLLATMGTCALVFYITHAMIGSALLQPIWLHPKEKECYSDNKVPAISQGKSVRLAQTWWHWWLLLLLLANLWSTSNPKKWFIPISSFRWGTTCLLLHKEEQVEMHIKLLLHQSKYIQVVYKCILVSFRFYNKN